MPNTVTLSTGHSVELYMSMADFRVLWQKGDVSSIQAMNQEGGDLGQAYPLLAKTILSWDITDKDGNPLDPSDVASYDKIEPPVFMQLMLAVSRYISGSSKN